MKIKVLQNAPKEHSAIILDLHPATICLYDLCFVYFLSGRFTQVLAIGMSKCL